MATSISTAISRQPPLLRREMRCVHNSSRHLGYKKREWGLQWHPSKDALMASNPGRVLVSAPYSFRGKHRYGTHTAYKFASFESHWSYWDMISSFEENSRMHSLHEVIPSDAPRCLYFDIDGKISFAGLHHEIMSWLRMYVRWVFSGDRCGWEEQDPQPVVLSTDNPEKYSCHVVFPQIQFADFAEQERYMKILLAGLPKFQVELEGGEEIPLLERVIDHVPYTRFQNFRGPFACKLKDGMLRAETKLEPEGIFENSELSCFVGHVDTDRALPLPSVRELLDNNPELRDLSEVHRSRVSAATGGGCTLQDMALYETIFQRPGGGTIHLSGLPELDMYKEALRWLHPHRAIQYWSWWRISGVTENMLEKFGADPVKRAEIWKAHHSWSMQYPHFNEEENVMLVEKARGRRLPGLSFLLMLVRFDNPQMKVRSDFSGMRTSWRPTSRQNTHSFSSERIGSTEIVLPVASSAHPNQTIIFKTEGTDHGATLPAYAAIARDVDGACRLSR